MSARAVVIGIGNPMRRDDGVGPAVVDALIRAGAAVELVVADGEPTRLLEAWRDRALAVVVDAVLADAEPGTVERIEMEGRRVDAPRTTSSHGAGLAEALALGVALDRAPERLVLYGVQPADLGVGSGLTTAVAGVVPSLVAAIIDEIDRSSGS